MPKTPPPRDRFDDVPEGVGRVGAHRAENPRLRGGAVLLWSAVATVVLVGIGVFGSMVATGRITIFPTPEASVAVVPTAEPTLDVGYNVTILNATPQRGLAATMRDTVVSAGFPADNVIEGDAGSQDFTTTTVFYATPADEGAARGLAQAIGGAAVAQSDAYQPADDPATEADESTARQLVVVIGLDRTTGAEATATP